VAGYNPYATGNRVYGGGRPMPNIGPSDPSGYAQRDMVNRSRRNAMLRRLKQKQAGNLMHPDVLRWQ
jgi:hypothetical protein